MRTTMWVSWVVTSCVVALAGPFGTFATQPFKWRLLYSSGVIAIAILMGLTARTVLRQVLKNRPTWVEDLFVAISLALVFGPTVVWINHRLGGDDAREAMGLGLGRLSVFGVSCCISAARSSNEQPSNKGQGKTNFCRGFPSLKARACHGSARTITTFTLSP